MTGVLKDVIPFGLSYGNRNYLKGINLIGLRRKKYDNKKIIELDQANKKIFFNVFVAFFRAGALILGGAA